MIKKLFRRKKKECEKDTPMFELKDTQMFELKDTTFIIPIYVESSDRINNAKSVLGFLNKNFKTNVIIHELVDDESKLIFLDDFNNLKIKHMVEKIKGKNYHRTRQLNEMLAIVETEVVCNYDIDVLLPITSYIISEQLLKNDIFDVIYPYGFGKFQMKIEKSISVGGVDINSDRDRFNKDFLISNIEEELLTNDRSEYGHCMFFRTDSYKKMGGENENFISYGPEDTERYNRCVKFGLRIYRIRDCVYHFEHSRTSFSNKDNPDFLKNKEIFENLNKKSLVKFITYYKTQEYIKKYNFSVSMFDGEINPDLYIEHDIKDLIKYPKYNKNNIILNEKTEVDKIEVKKPDIKIIEKPLPTNPITVRKKFCNCGELVNNIEYNFCQKCKKIYK